MDRPFGDSQQVGSVVRSRVTKNGIQDIRSLRVAWCAGFTYVGNGTNGTADSVYYAPFSGGTPKYLIIGNTTGISGQAPILSADPDVGAAYLEDVEKHFARKIIKRMWIHVDSLQPSTSNNMMAAIGVSRGPGGSDTSLPDVVATASVLANTVPNVLSMKKSFTVDSWEHSSHEITDCIAGGSGPRQNEFEVQGFAPHVTVESFYSNGSTGSTSMTTIGLVPASFAVAGNSTSAGLRGTNVHQITFEQEIDLVDFVGGMSGPNPEN